MTPVAILVGEAPGDHENRKRKPFAGPAGDVLTGVLTSIGLTRSDVFVTNVVKYRPTVGQISIRNRTPSTAEQVASWPYLMEELDVFPRETPVVAMGNVALYALHWHATWRISDAHGTSWERQDGRPAYAWYHPAVAVYDPDMMPTLVDDARTTLLTDVLRGRQRR
jgi:DNA polymerase